MSRWHPSPRYPEQFRKDAVELVQSSDQPVRQIARDLGVNPETLRNWVNAAKKRSTTTAEPALTVAERVDTAIEVRNGTWTKNLAHETRSLLSQEGFKVAKIGNHLDFGATKTMIYYRPEAEKVARAVGRTIFPGAELEPSLKLKKDMDIKILLGADLLERPKLMARLAGEDK